jgi:serine/threonine-protein kinase
MEYLPGRTLADAIADGPIEPDLAGRVLWQVASGMAAAHRRGLVHGDLKPANIMVTECGTAKVLDFGLARREHAPLAADLDATVDEADLEPAGLSGTPSYMAPEQAQGEAPTSASDVFALGVITYEMLTGRKAFPGANLLQVLNQIARVDPDRLADGLPCPFDDIVRQALAPDPDDREICMEGVARLLADPACPFEPAIG